jgi:hypothetical protein
VAQSSTSILDELQAHLSGDTINDISRRIGADPDKTRAAVDGAVPMLLAALGKEAADPSRRDGLHQAISQDHDGSIIDNLQAYLNGQMTGRAADGQGIVDHVLGDRKEPAVQALAGKSGLDLGTIASLLPLLAPIVMGMIGKKQQGGGLSMDSITDVLGGDTQRAANQSPDLGDLLGSVLGGGQGQAGGSGGIGDVLGSIFGKG